jgi:hypothetical protein
MLPRKMVVTLAAIIVLLPSVTYGTDYVQGEIIVKFDSAIDPVINNGMTSTARSRNLTLRTSIPAAGNGASMTLTPDGRNVKWATGTYLCTSRRRARRT